MIGARISGSIRKTVWTVPESCSDPIPFLPSDKAFGATEGKADETILEHDAHELRLTLEDIRNRQSENQPRNTLCTQREEK
jgi:hypothetical protein